VTEQAATEDAICFIRLGYNLCVFSIIVQHDVPYNVADT